MRNYGRNDVEVDVEITGQSAGAWLVKDASGTEVWIPKSQGSIEPGRADLGDTVTLTLPEWMAEERGLI